MNNPDDKKLRELLKNARETEENNAPDFEKVWQSAASKAGTQRASRNILRYAVAAMLLLLISSALWLFNRNVAEIDPLAATSISNWESPTANLLAFPGKKLTQQQSGPLLAGRTSAIVTGGLKWENTTGGLLQYSGRGRLSDVPVFRHQNPLN